MKSSLTYCCKECDDELKSKRQNKKIRKLVQDKVLAELGHIFPTAKLVLFRKEKLRKRYRLELKINDNLYKIDIQETEKLGYDFRSIYPISKRRCMIALEISNKKIKELLVQ